MAECGHSDWPGKYTLELMRDDVTFPFYVEAKRILNLACRPRPSCAGSPRCRSKMA